MARVLAFTVPADEIVIWALVWGFLSFNYARTFQRRRGQLPWGLHPGLWGLIGVFIGLIGFILLFIATRTTKPPMQNPFGHGPYGEPRQFGQPPQFGQQGWNPSSPPPIWNATPLQAPPPPIPPPPIEQEVDTLLELPLPPAATAAAWLADPKDGARYRYFDGSRWTDWISTESAGVSEDPV
ncbi:MAG TPA: DUF2510 domain-containing protein [Acidimicrobiales bacterium]|jgi:hypothetical protein